MMEWHLLLVACKLHIILLFMKATLEIKFRVQEKKFIHCWLPDWFVLLGVCQQCFGGSLWENYQVCSWVHQCHWVSWSWLVKILVFVWLIERPLTQHHPTCQCPSVPPRTDNNCWPSPAIDRSFAIYCSASYWECNRSNLIRNGDYIQFLAVS